MQREDAGTPFLSREMRDSGALRKSSYMADGRDSAFARGRDRFFSASSGDSAVNSSLVMDG